MSQSVSSFFLFFPVSRRILSIRFVLLNYLIRTHPSRQASREVLLTQYQLLPTYLSTLCCQTLSSSSLHFPCLEIAFCIRRVTPSILFFFLFLILFLLFASRQIVGNRSDSQDSIGSDFRKCTDGHSLIQSRNITLLDSKTYGSRWKIFLNYCRVFAICLGSTRIFRET